MELVAVYSNGVALYTEQWTDRPDFAFSAYFSLVENPAAKLLIEVLSEVVSRELCRELLSCSEKSAECLL